MTEPLTGRELREMRARCEAATEGPWPESCERLVHFKAFLQRTGAERPTEDIAFIAHARTDLPRLLDELFALRTAAREFLRVDLDVALYQGDPSLSVALLQRLERGRKRSDLSKLVNEAGDD